ncbi:MAG: S8 family serine peptidase [Candidatus Tumulicola sp.]
MAIVDAYDNPDVASDLSTYRSEFGLPTANFIKYNQNGQTKKYPSPDTTWGLEEDLDVQMVAASCPNCTIYLVEANSNAAINLETAEAEAVKLGAHIVSNSWICYGSSNCFNPSYFDTPGVTYLAVAGDHGYGIGAPMAFANVVAVGGTTLSKNGGTRGWTETVWDGTGSGCASGVAKPSWQHDPDCTYRMANDVAADADPSTGAAVYDTFGNGGWLVEGGTSLSTPLIAGVFALAGNATSQHGGETFWDKRHEKTADLYRITSGNNGSCSPTYYCTDGTHQYEDYGGPTGWGTPHGIGAF